MRLDIYLKENGFFESRKKASDAIKDGCVKVGGKIADKPSLEIDGQEVTVTGSPLKYVGRGGLKLEHALDAFGIDVKDAVCADVGSSTGGFTDVLLTRGAKYVYAIDSGSDQLHPKLRKDERVCVMERTNARNLDPEKFGDGVDVVTLDVSFISQTLIHGSVSEILKGGGAFVSLIKPQFECGRASIGKNGIVRSETEREYAVRKVIESAKSHSLEHRATVVSPIRGGDGNVEFLVYFVKKK